jgi:PilZ domain
MQERRKITRTRVLKGAKFLLGNSSVRDCVVRDLTNAGACIDIPNTIDLPETLNLTFNDSHSFQPCRLVWRKIRRAGVEFV